MVFSAIKSGREEFVKLLVEKYRVPLDIRGESEKTPLMVAAKHGKLSVVKYILSRGDVDWQARDELNNTVLHHAITRVHLKSLKSW